MAAAFFAQEEDARRATATEETVTALPLAPSAASRVGRAGSSAQEQSQSQSVVEFKEVSLAYLDRLVLDRLSWTVRAGENWVDCDTGVSHHETVFGLNRPYRICGLFQERGDARLSLSLSSTLSIHDPKYLSETHYGTERPR